MEIHPPCTGYCEPGSFKLEEDGGQLRLLQDWRTGMLLMFLAACSTHYFSWHNLRVHVVCCIALVAGTILSSDDCYSLACFFLVCVV